MHRYYLLDSFFLLGSAELYALVVPHSENVGWTVAYPALEREGPTIGAFACAAYLFDSGSQFRYCSNHSILSPVMP
jgi:hypothetical protein